MTVLYVIAIAAVLWPAIHEQLGWRIAAWNCIVPTLGIISVVVASDKKAARIAALAFALIAMLTVFAFVAAWAFAPLDIDPHSATTVLVFVYLPIVSLALAAAAYLIVRVNVAD